MGLNHMQLPLSLMTDLYKTHLIESSVTAVAAKRGVHSTSPLQRIQYLGNNQKGICLLVSYSKDVYLPDEQLLFFTSILQACKLNVGDVAIVNQHQQKISFEEIHTQLNCSQLLVFGVALPEIGLENMPLFTIQHVDGCQVVYSLAAEKLNNNNAESKVLKGKLWTILKQLFNV